MRITLRLYGNLKKYASDKRDRTVVEAPDGQTIRQVLESLGVPESGWWMVAVNDTVVQQDVTLRDGDLLEIFEPVAGGGQPL